ncbi:MAG: hypothetical protein Q8O37_12415 [Sulfuricellaceae bacterium]|nr:hypothetical protein [Sulfuricellaceae bacterium]
MQPLSSRQQLAVGLIFTLLMAVTRSHHWATLSALPDASWAIFFLAGFYLRPIWIVPAFMLETVLVDYVAITWGGVSSYCISPAYGFLIPAYAMLFLAGRVYTRHHRLSWAAFPWLLGCAVAGAGLAELFSSGGFYLFSGRFPDPTLADFMSRLSKYFPSMFSSMMLYLGLGAIVHVSVASLRGASGQARQP